MGLKDILVYLDQSKANSQRLDTAADTAQAFQAHLTGLTIAQTPHIPEFMPADFIRQQQKAAEERNANIRKSFEERMRGTDILWDWRAVSMTSPAETPLDVLALHSHYADMTIVGQPRPDDVDAVMPRDLPGKLAMVSGRPSSVGVRISPVASTGTSLANAPRMACRTACSSLSCSSPSEPCTSAMTCSASSSETSCSSMAR